MVITPPAVSNPKGRGATFSSSPVGQGLTGVGALVQALTVEEFLKQLGDAGGTTHQDGVLDLGLVRPGFPQGLLHGLQGAAEEVRQFSKRA